MWPKVSLIFLLLPNLLLAQFKNVKLAEGATATEPSITINKKNPNNIIAASTLGNAFFSIDGGATWKGAKLSSAAGVYRNSVLVSDDKGNIYAFHTSDPTGEGWKNEKSMDYILCHTSKDGGQTWEEGTPIGLNSGKDQVKPAATVDPKGNVWVSWTQFDKYKSDDENCHSVVLLTSSSNGKKWSRPLQISQTPGNCKDDDNTAKGAVPAVSVDGKAFVAWANQNKIFLDRSFNDGALWLSNDIAVSQQPGGWDMKVPGHDRSSGMPVILIDQTKTFYQSCVYLAWADQRNGENDTDVWFMRTTNFGDNWSTPLKLGDDKNKRHQYLPAITVDQTTGYIYAVYYDRQNYEDNQTDVFLAYSNDSGGSFKSIKISETPFIPNETDAFGDYINISAHKGIITPVWTRSDDGKTSVWTTTIKQADLIQVPQASSKKKKK